MLKRALFLFFLFFYTPLATAITVPAALPRLSLGLSYDYWYVQTPGGNREDRAAYSAAAMVGAFNYFRAELHGTYAPDLRTRSAGLIVRENYTTFTPMLAFAYPFFFRIVAAAGPSYISTETRYAFDTSSENFSEQEWAYTGRLGLEYAFSERFELALNAGAIQRPTRSKRDYFYGTQLGVNLL